MMAQQSERPVHLMAASAMAYAEKFGWQVFPVFQITRNGVCACGRAQCKRPGKHPIGAAVPRGLKDASRDPAIVRKWWKEYPQANIGIPTGAISGFSVLDVDMDKGGEDSLFSLEQDHGKLPETVIQLTGGGGYHYLFKVPFGVKIKNSVESLGAGLDIRGDGGYIVGAPSNHIRGREYAWEASCHPKDTEIADMPGWLLERVRDQPKATKAEPEKGGVILPPSDVARIRQAMVYIDPETRETWLEVGMSLHSTGAGRQGFGLWVEWSRESEKFDPADAARVWSSFKTGGGITMATLFNRAKAGGWVSADGATSTGQGWESQLSRSAKGATLQTLANIETILMNDPRWRGVIAFDQFEQRVVKRALPPVDGGDTGEWGDSDDARAVIWLERNYAISPSSRLICEAVRVVAERYGFHPVRDYLAGLKWDGKPRCKTWMIKYLGAEDGPFSRSVGQCYLIAAVGRILEPGCKFDNVLILEGAQGIGKSTALNILASPWFSDTPFDLGSKDAFIAMRGKWIIEIGELDSFSRADNSRAKQFFASQRDTYREPYGRHSVDIARQCVFAGTANPDQYFKDETGNRRYWPVLTTRVDLAALRRDRDQLWAEAVHLFRAGEPMWVDHTLDYIAAEQESRYMRDTWEDVLDEWLSHRNECTLNEALVDCLLIAAGKQTRTDQMRAAAALKRLGWRRVRAIRFDGARHWCYRKVGTK